MRHEVAKSEVECRHSYPSIVDVSILRGNSGNKVVLQPEKTPNL
ncbi:hypothetical protein [Microcystis aeruginosa]|nr:hypothetical protein [Microcystis aeruginosa]MDB9395345.1 hypothetical protein [Microcystis aeruginosa CS-573]